MLRWSLLVVILLAVASAFLALGWWLRGTDVLGNPILELDGCQGFTVLISPGSTQGTAVYGPAGSVVPFLSNSDMNVLDPTGRYLFTSHETRIRAGVTRIDLDANEVAVLLEDAEFTRFDGLLWTPWNSLLVAEEDKDGRLFEILNPLAPPEHIEYVIRPAFGLRRHEGLAIDWRGYVYGVEDDSKGAIYRFRPSAPLTPQSLESGELEVLVVLDEIDELEERRVNAVWQPAGISKGTAFDRPEDIELVGHVLYVAVTGEHRVISVDLTGAEATTLGEYVGRDRNAKDLNRPDNLASDPDGNLYIAEDIGAWSLIWGRNQLWYAVTADDPLAPAKSVTLFATLKSRRDELTGLLVDATGDRLFINVMGPNDSILAVRLGLGRGLCI